MSPIKCLIVETARLVIKANAEMVAAIPGSETWREAKARKEANVAYLRGFASLVKTGKVVL